MKTYTKHIKLQVSGDADAVNATIALLHSLNFINGSIWSNAVRKRGEPSIVRVASRAIEVPCCGTDSESSDGDEYGQIALRKSKII